MHAAYYEFHALLIEGTLNCETAALQNVSVDHGGFDILVSKKFLDSANIVTALKQVGGKAVTKGVATDRLVCDTGQTSGGTHGFLKAAFIGMVAAHYIRARVDGEAFGREDVLPGPFAGGVGVFVFKGIRQVDGSVPLLDILLEDLLHAGKMFLEGDNQALGQHGQAVFFAFAIVDDEAVLFEVDIFDSQANTFNEAQPGAIENFCHELVNAGQGVDDTQGFAFGQDGGKTLGLLRSNGSDVIEGLMENFAIEEQNGAEGLILSGGSDFTLGGEVGNEGFDFGHTHVLGVAFFMK